MTEQLDPKILDHYSTAHRILRISFQVKLKAGIKFDEEAKVFVSFAPALQLYSQGLTKTEAKRALQDAVESWLIVAYENEVLERALQQSGFKTVPTHVAQSPASDQYISWTEEEILEEQHFEDIWDLPTSLNLSSHQALQTISG